MKKFIAIVLCIITIFSLSSCGKKDEVKIIDISLTEEEYAYGIRKDNISLQNDFNQFLTEIKEDGTYDEIVKKYFSDEGKKEGFKISTGTVVNDDTNFIVATNCPFEPFEYIGTDGYAYGIDMEIANLYAKEKGLTLVIKNINFEAILNDVASGYSDIAMAGMTITEERLKVCNFTNTYYSASQKLVVSKATKLFDDCKTKEDVENVLKSLSNEKLGYQIGSTGNWYVTGSSELGFEGFNNLTPTGYSTAQLAIKDIINGSLFGVIVDEAPGNVMVEKINGNSAFKTFVNAMKKAQFQSLVLTGLKNTVIIALLGLLIGILIGTLIAIVKVAPKYKWYLRLMDKICTVYVAIFRGTPIVVQLLLAYYVFVPLLGIKGVSALNTSVIVFGLNSAAYVSEMMRGGLNSVDKGQLEAGRALGLSYPVTMRKIVIPQAIKNILPTLGNEFISLIKETSVVSFITVVDLYTAFNTIGTNTYDVVIPYIIMAIIYIVLVVIITILIKLIERRISKSDRRN